MAKAKKVVVSTSNDTAVLKHQRSHVLRKSSPAKPARLVVLKNLNDVMKRLRAGMVISHQRSHLVHEVFFPKESTVEYTITPAVYAKVLTVFDAGKELTAAWIRTRGCESTWVIGCIDNKDLRSVTVKVPKNNWEAENITPKIGALYRSKPKPSRSEAAELKVGDIVACFFKDSYVPRQYIVLSRAARGEDFDRIECLPVEAWGSDSREKDISSVNTDKWEKVGTLKGPSIKK